MTSPRLRRRVGTLLALIALAGLPCCNGGSQNGGPPAGGEAGKPASGGETGTSSPGTSSPETSSPGTSSPETSSPETPTPPEPPESSGEETPMPEPSTGPHPGLLDPSQAVETAPASFRAKFETSKGDFIIEVQRAWSPEGADRFYNLVKIGFYDEARFFRVLSGFMAQIGINGDPAVMAKWRDANIRDDPVVESNRRGYVTFAKSALPNSRSTQIFINYGDNRGLDRDGFSPFGKVVEGMEVVDSLHSGYGEGAPRGRGPSQGLIQSQGNAYLQKSFPKLDWVKKATIVE